MANWDFFKLPAGTTPQNAGLNDAPPAGKAYRTHTYSDGTVVWAIVPVQTSSITLPSVILRIPVPTATLKMSA